MDEFIQMVDGCPIYKDHEGYFYYVQCGFYSEYKYATYGMCEDALLGNEN